MARSWSIGIIGGGPGGLFTAWLLDQLLPVPQQITLFEASSRLGGKVETRQFPQGPLYEAGAAEFYDYSPVDEDPLKELIAELGLVTVPMGGATLLFGHRQLANLDDVASLLGPEAAAAWRRFDARAHDWMSPREYFHADHHPTPAWNGAPTADFRAVLEQVDHPVTRDLVAMAIHSDLATEPELTNPAYGLQNYLMNDPAYMRLYSIVGGNEQLVTQLAGRISARVLRQHPVQAVEAIAPAFAGGVPRVRVHTAPEGVVETHDFDLVVVALPYAALERVTFLPESLAQPMSRHLAHYNHPADYLRITLLFDTPFWRPIWEEGYCMLDAFGGCCLYDESARDPTASQGVLGFLLAGQTGGELCARTDAELLDLALNALPGAFAQARSLLRDHRVQRWPGAVSALPGGRSFRPVDLRHQPAPAICPGLYVVGDYLFDSTLNGVLDSATHVAEAIACRVAEQPALAVH
jgi:protoporphyrinogen oxidase